MMNRRHFLGTLAAGTAGVALAPSAALGADETHLVVLHTNDTHSRIDPFPPGGDRLAGLGGVARRATLVRRVRAAHPHVLLLDSGDIFQGTPYFNFFRGEIEFRSMSAMGYDLATLGNHDFDIGVDGLVAALPHADFGFVSANYAVTNPALAPHVAPHAVREVGGVRVGILGLGIELGGLVLPGLYPGVAYTDPVAAARRSVAALREAGCAYVIALSHLGYRYDGDRPSDWSLAHEVAGIDLILGGHTHTFLDAPVVAAHPSGWETVIHQVGWGGVRLGRVDVVFGPDGRPRRWTSGAYDVDARLDG